MSSNFRKQGNLYGVNLKTCSKNIETVLLYLTKAVLEYRMQIYFRDFVSWNYATKKFTNGRKSFIFQDVEDLELLPESLKYKMLIVSSFDLKREVSF